MFRLFPITRTNIPSFLSFRTIFVQTERTPNENSLKFLPGTNVLPHGYQPIEFLNMDEARKRSSLATCLFKIKGVSSVFFGPDFISVNKVSDMEWKHIKPHIFATLMDWFGSSPVRDTIIENEEPKDSKDSDPEVVQMIKELLDTRIRPSIQMDGGDVEYNGFKDGYVRLKLKGACRSCSSSVVTLKHGIERMLMHYMPEIKGVEQVEDELMDQGTKIFQEYEKKKHSSK